MSRNYLLFIFLGLVMLGMTPPRHKPTVYIIGDSTVKNGRGDGAGGLWGWGDPIAQYFDTARISIENHALGGTSSRTYQTRGLWNEVLGKLKKGDFVLMQFGHNDGGAINDTLRARGTIPGVGEETVEIDNLITKEHEIVHSYGWYMRKMVREARAKGATPVIITLIPRNDWEEGKIRRTPGSFPAWSMKVAGKEKVICIDLNKSLSDKLDSLGESQVTGKYFLSHDHTHTSAAGSLMAASLLVRDLTTAKGCKLKKYLLDSPGIVFPFR